GDRPPHNPAVSHRRDPRQPRRPRGPGAAGRQRRLQMRADPAIRGARSAPPQVQGARLRRARLSVQRLHGPGARHGGGDRRLLLDPLRRELPHVRQAEREGPRPAPTLPCAHRGPPPAGGHRRAEPDGRPPAPDRRRRRRRRRRQLEFREVPPRPRRPRPRPLRPPHRAGRAGGGAGDRGGVGGWGI
ncbi:MAG: Glutathione peroxidase @ Thioredoxin peroxidase, partial [uncultured Sphingomonadaceae bacterium]